jgi:hypothetical protein
VATEFIRGRHLLQEEAHIRALVFDFLWPLADEIDRWCEPESRSNPGPTSTPQAP